LPLRCASCGATHTVTFSVSAVLPNLWSGAGGKSRVRGAGSVAQRRAPALDVFGASELRELLLRDRSLLRIVAKAASEATIRAMGTRCKLFAPLPGVMATVHTYGQIWAGTSMCMFW